MAIKTERECFNTVDWATWRAADP